MAPSAVETTIVTDRTFQAPTAKLVGGIGAYKDVTDKYIAGQCI